MWRQRAMSRKVRRMQPRRSGRSRSFRRTLLVVMFALSCGAQQLEPRAYSPSPVGTTFLGAGFSRDSGGVTFDPSVPVTDVRGALYSSFPGVGHTFGFAGRQALVTVAQPYAWGTLSGSVGEQRRSITRSGLAGMSGKFALNLIGSPALKPKDFAIVPHRNFIMAASLTVTTPTGQYDETKLINLGTNRWSFRPELGFSRLIRKVSVDLYAAGTFFTANSSYYPGQSFRSQDALASVQAHVSYTFRRGLWVAVDSTWYGGGAVRLNRGPAMSRQDNTRLGGTLSLPIGKVQSVKFAYSSGVSARTGSNFNTLAVSWQYIKLSSK